LGQLLELFGAEGLVLGEGGWRLLFVPDFVVKLFQLASEQLVLLLDIHFGRSGCGVTGVVLGSLRKGFGGSGRVFRHFGHIAKSTTTSTDHNPIPTGPQYSGIGNP
jgi:hypothetical protein